MANCVHYEVLILSEGIEAYVSALLAHFYGLKTALVLVNSDNSIEQQPPISLDAVALQIFATLGLSSYLDKNHQHPNLTHFLSQRLIANKQIAYYPNAAAEGLSVDNNHPNPLLLSFVDNTTGKKCQLAADFLLCGKDIPDFLPNQIFAKNGCKYTQYRPQPQFANQIVAARVARQWRNGACFLLAAAAYRLPAWVSADTRNNLDEQKSDLSVQTKEWNWALSAALQDAQNLLWKLFLVVNKRANEHLLTAYQGERLPVVEKKLAYCLSRLEYTASQSASFLSKLFHKKPQPNPEPERVDFGVIANPIHQLANISTQSRKVWGTCSPQYLVKGENGLNFQPDKFQTGGFLLMGWDKNPVDWLTVADIDFLAGLRCNFLQIIPAHQPFGEQIRHTHSAQDAQVQQKANSNQPNTQNWQQWFKQHKTDFVLLRPDRVIFGTANDMHQLGELLRQLRVKLAYQPVVFPELADEDFYQWAAKAEIQI